MDDPLVQATSTRLLRITGLLISQLEPVEGLKTGAARLVVEQLKDLLEEVDQKLSKDVRQLLDSALSSLAPSNASELLSSEPLSYFSCTRALSHLSSALFRLAEPPPPPAPSPISRLPAELVAHIVSFCQVDDLRIRQNTNLALASTCRAFHAVVQPILRAEVHLFTPGQLERVTERVEQFGSADSGIRTLTVDLVLAELKRRPDGRWPGRRLPRLIEMLGQGKAKLQVLAVHLQPCERAHAVSELDNHAYELEAALGINPYDMGDLFGRSLSHPYLKELHVPALDYESSWVAVAEAVFDLPRQIRSLRVGHPAYPSIVEMDDLNMGLMTRQMKVWDARNEGATQHLHTLALPWFQWKPQDFLAVFGARKTVPAPPLRHLDTTFSIENPSSDFQLIIEFFSSISTTLCHLSLRIVDTRDSRWSMHDLMYQTRFLLALNRLPHLDHLEIGGKFIETLIPQVATLPSLRHLTLLPFPLRTNQGYSLDDIINDFPGRLESITLCIPKMDDLRRAGGWNERVLRMCLESAEGRGFEIRTEERQEEFDRLR